jgi:hypothetical protein
MRWKGPALALLGAAAVAGIAIGFTLGGGDDKSVTPGSISTGESITSSSTGTTGTITGEGVSIPKPGQVRLGHRLLVGTLDDAMKQANPKTAADLMKVSHDAGFDSVLVSSMWQPGATAPSAEERHTLGNVVRAADDLHMRVFVFVWHGLSGATPRTERARGQFAAYAAALAKAFPQIRDIVVGNEPNLNTFWMPQFGPGGMDVAATGYLDLLARSYDALKAVSPDIRVLGGALAPRGSDRPGTRRDTHSPTRFIEDLGVAYKASGRTKPIMDAFAIHPYMRMSRVSPTETHATSTTITVADYPKLVTLLGRAFRGTQQRAADLPIYYTEFGVQTSVPAPKRRFYVDLDSPARSDAVSFTVQAAYYRRALELAYCQPTVRGLFFFHTFDEPGLNGWQSGVYFADRTPKPTLAPFKRAVADLRAGRLPRCRR